MTSWAELLKAWLALTIGSAVSKPIRCQGIKRWLTLTMLRATGPWLPSPSSLLKLSIVPLHELSVRNHKQPIFEWRGEKRGAQCFFLQLLLTIQANQSDKHFTSQGGENLFLEQ